MASDSPKTIKLLLAAGASVDAIDSMGRTALYGTVISGNLDAAKILLEAGANPNREDSQGQSPYTDTLSRQQPQMTALLAKYGGRSSLAQAAKRAAAKIIVPIVLSPMGR